LIGWSASPDGVVKHRRGDGSGPGGVSALDGGQDPRVDLVLIAGDDEDAKSKVAAFARDGGSTRSTLTGASYDIGGRQLV
jgi:hypothetical protein